MISGGKSSATHKLSVAIVCASVSRKAGGIFPIMQAHARELSRLGAKVSVHGVWDGAFDTDSESWAPAPLHVHRPRLSRFAYAPSLNRSLGNTSHDILHQHGIWLYPSIAVLHWRRR